MGEHGKGRSGGADGPSANAVAAGAAEPWRRARLLPDGAWPLPFPIGQLLRLALAALTAV